MGGESPTAVLYDFQGNELALQNGAAIPASTPLLMIGGSDGTDSRYITVDTSGRQVMVGIGTAGTPVGGVLTIQGVSGGTVVPVSGTVTTSNPDVSTSGALGSLNATISVTHPGLQSIGMQLAAGTLVGTIVPEASFDGGTTWNATFFDNPANGNITTAISFASSNTATALSIVGVGGSGMTRVRVSAYTSGTANVTVRASDINDPSLLSGGAAASALPPVIQQVGGSVTTGVPTYGTGTFNALSLNTSGGLRVDGSAVTQPVSGTVTANQGTPNTKANAWTTELTDGTNGPVAVKAASTAAVAADPALVVAVSPNNTIAATQSGTWTVQQGTPPWTVQGDAANGAAVAGNPVLSAGSDGTDARTMLTDSSGRQVMVGAAAGGAAVAGNPVLVAGSDGTDARTMLTDASGRPIILDGQTAETTAAWTSATTVNSTSAITITGYGTVTVTLNQTTTITGGVVTFEASDTVAGTNWYPVALTPTTVGVPSSTYTLTASTNASFQAGIGAFIQFRVRLSTVITGTGTVNVGIAASASAIDPQEATYITDGSHGPVAVKPASTAAVVGDPALVVTISPNSAILQVSTSGATATPGNAPGYITLTTTTNTAQQATTYTEQSANFTGSVKSSSASDASAGTGARTITIYYVDQTGATAGNEVATLNGTTAVNLVTTTKCFIEKIVVTTVGSGGSNAGIISLFTAAAGGGTLVATIAASDNQTYLGHHYVVTGKTCNISGLTGLNNSTSQNTVFTLQATTLPVANQVNLQVSDWVSGSQNQQIVRLYDQLIKVPGPARIQLFGANGGTPSIKSQGSFDYYDQ